MKKRRKAPSSWCPLAVATAAALAGQRVALAIGTPNSGAASAPTGAASVNRFDIWEYRVLGASVLPVRTVERAVYPYLGPQRDINSVKQAAASLEKAYKDAGYGAVYVDIPVQEVDQGIVRLKVTEGRLEAVTVRGERYFSGRQILAQLPALQIGSSPHLPTLQDELAAVNGQTADRSVTPILKAGSAPGTMDVDLLVKDRLPLHASIAYDNRHTAYTTPNRLTATLAYDNLWQQQHSLSFEYQTAPADTQNEVVESATYLAPIGPSNSAVSFSYIRTRSNALALGTLGVLGAGDIYGAQWQRSIVYSAGNSASLQLGAAFKDVNTIVFPDTTGTGIPGSGAPVTAPVKYINWNGTYGQAWRSPLLTVEMSAAMNFGITGLENHEAEFENSRYEASPSYLYFRVSGDATQNLPLGFAVFGRMSGQWSDSPLVNNEQYSLGGIDTVRGYLEAEALGDSGIAGSLELHLPDLWMHLAPALGQLYGYGFVDGGVTTLLDPLPGQNYKLRLWSTGAGLRLQNPWGFTGALDYAVPEADGVTTHKGDSRIDFSVRYGF